MRGITPWTKKWLGLISLETGDPVAALEYTNHSIELDPLDVSVYSQLGAILNEMDDPDLAKKSYAAGIKVDPDDMRCRAGLASTLIKLGKLEDAKREIIEANKNGDEEHPLVLSVSALLDSFSGQKQEALNKIERVLTAESRSLDVLLLAHQLMTNLEEDEKAEEILETMQSLAPDDARVMTALLG